MPVRGFIAVWPNNPLFGSVHNLFAHLNLRLIERSHIYVALGGPCHSGDVAQPRGRQVEA